MRAMAGNEDCTTHFVTARPSRPTPKPSRGCAGWTWGPRLLAPHLSHRGREPAEHPPGHRHPAGTRIEPPALWPRTAGSTAACFGHGAVGHRSQLGIRPGLRRTSFLSRRQPRAANPHSSGLFRDHAGALPGGKAVSAARASGTPLPRESVDRLQRLAIEYFQEVARAKYRNGDPLFFYGHPTGARSEHRRWCGRCWRMGGDFAALLEDYAPRVGGLVANPQRCSCHGVAQGDEFVVEIDQQAGQYRIGVEYLRGRHVARMPLRRRGFGFPRHVGLRGPRLLAGRAAGPRGAARRLAGRLEAAHRLGTRDSRGGNCAVQLAKPGKTGPAIALTTRHLQQTVGRGRATAGWSAVGRGKRQNAAGGPSSFILRPSASPPRPPSARKRPAGRSVAGDGDPRRRRNSNAVARSHPAGNEGLTRIWRPWKTAWWKPTACTCSAAGPSIWRSLRPSGEPICGWPSRQSLGMAWSNAGGSRDRRPGGWFPAPLRGPHGLPAAPLLAAAALPVGRSADAQFLCRGATVDTLLRRAAAEDPRRAQRGRSAVCPVRSPALCRAVRPARLHPLCRADRAPQEPTRIPPRHAGSDAPIVILGDVVPGHERYLAECRRAAGDGVMFIDRLEHGDPLLSGAYAACGCLALASWYETPGLVALEAGMSGTPLCCPTPASPRSTSRPPGVVRRAGRRRGHPPRGARACACAGPESRIGRARPAKLLRCAAAEITREASKIL